MSIQALLDFISRLFGGGRNQQSTSTYPTPTSSQPSPNPEPIPPTPSQPLPTNPIPPPPVPVSPVPVAPMPIAPTPIVTSSRPVSVPDSTNLPKEGPNLGFGKLWNNHPNISDGELFPCRSEDGVSNFGNQCAIRMGVCLMRSGLLGSDYDGAVCWFGHQNQGHVLRARELALWLRNHAQQFGAVEVRSNISWEDYVDRTGIVYFQNFWGDNNQGDHIDVWDGTGEFMGSGAFSWEGPAMASGGLDYFARAEEVWFWPCY